MKAIWKGSLSFGLVNIPISVYPASEEHALEFHMLHNIDLSPVRFARICKEDGKEIPYSDIVKGYEYEKGEYVVIDDEDFKMANAKKTSTIEIQQFTELKSIDPIYYEKPYYLEPDNKSQKAFGLLHEALRQTKKVAIVNFVFRNREHIGVILPSEEGLLLIQMRFHAEIRHQEEIAFSKQKISASELKMVITLINQSTKPFSPEKYHDTYTEELMAVIEQKIKGKKIKQKPSKHKPSYETRDLMSLLQASLKKSIDETPQKTKKSLHIPPSKKRASQRKRAS